MHGIIFSALRDFLTARGGPELAQRVFGGGPEYVISRAYPDEALSELVQRAAEEIGLDPDTLLEEFGAYTGEQVFRRLYPAFYTTARDTRSFLLDIELRIHELVRATVPDAAPPRLHVSKFAADGVEILYDSPRRLCCLLRGLAAGTARSFGEHAEIRETQCMNRGADACRFEVRLERR